MQRIRVARWIENSLTLEICIVILTAIKGRISWRTESWRFHSWIWERILSIFAKQDTCDPEGKRSDSWTWKSFVSFMRIKGLFDLLKKCENPLFTLATFFVESSFYFLNEFSRYLGVASLIKVSVSCSAFLTDFNISFLRATRGILDLFLAIMST